MSMERLCLIFSCICVSTVLFAHEKVMKLSHSPAELHVRVGEMAEFTCNLTMLKIIPNDINWYKRDPESTKIADTKDTHNNRFKVTMYHGQKKAMLNIKNVTLNDSGLYYCGYLNINDPTETVLNSNTSELIVENLNYSTPTVNDQPKKGPGEQKSEHSQKNIVIATSILLVLLMLLIGIAAFLVWYKKRNKMPPPQLRHLEKQPQDSDAYTVDYGVLDFDNSQPFRKSAEISVQEQVEYATIMFP